MVSFECKQKLIKSCFADDLKMATFYLAHERPETTGSVKTVKIE